jgi:hypothetical protein
MNIIEVMQLNHSRNITTGYKEYLPAPRGDMKKGEDEGGRFPYAWE